MRNIVDANIRKGRAGFKKDQHQGQINKSSNEAKFDRSINGVNKSLHEQSSQDGGGSLVCDTLCQLLEPVSTNYTISEDEQAMNPSFSQENWAISLRLTKLLAFLSFPLPGWLARLLQTYIHTTIYILRRI